MSTSSACVARCGQCCARARVQACVRARECALIVLRGRAQTETHAARLRGTVCQREESYLAMKAKVETVLRKKFGGLMGKKGHIGKLVFDNETKELHVSVSGVSPPRARARAGAGS